MLYVSGLILALLYPHWYMFIRKEEHICGKGLHQYSVENVSDTLRALKYLPPTLGAFKVKMQSEDPAFDKSLANITQTDIYFAGNTYLLFFVVSGYVRRSRGVITSHFLCRDLWFSQHHHDSSRSRGANLLFLVM